MSPPDIPQRGCVQDGLYLQSFVPVESAKDGVDTFKRWSGLANTGELFDCHDPDQILNDPANRVPDNVASYNRIGFRLGAPHLSNRPDLAAHNLHGDQISVIAVPAMDLMYEIDQGYNGTEYQWAINFDLEGKVATVSDGVDVQLENIEDQPDLFEGTLLTMVHQIKEARRQANKNPDIPIYIGLATAVVNKHIKTETLVALLWKM
jgi:hypothetical protein